MMVVTTMLALAMAAQITDGGRAAYDTPLPRIAAAPGGGTADIRKSIRDGRRAGQLSRREACELHRGTAAIEASLDRLAADGLSESEAGEIAARTEARRGLVGARRLGASVSPPSPR